MSERLMRLRADGNIEHHDASITAFAVTSSKFNYVSIDEHNVASRFELSRGKLALRRRFTCLAKMILTSKASWSQELLIHKLNDTLSVPVITSRRACSRNRSWESSDGWGVVEGDSNGTAIA